MTGHSQFAPAAQGVSIDCRDDRFRKIFNFVPDVLTAFQEVDGAEITEPARKIGARAEGLFARAGDDDASDGFVGFNGVEMLPHGFENFPAQLVHLRFVDR
jgi:hypothetical protein